MSKLLQFRCPGCHRLLFKVETGKTTCEYQDKDMRYQHIGKMMIVECSKCKNVLEVTKHGLVEFVPKAEAKAENVGVQV
jgi:hypothetical protein